MYKYLLFIILSASCFALDKMPEDLEVSDDQYYLRMYNGDIIKGYVVEITDEKSFRFETELGTTSVFIDDVKEIIHEDDYYRHGHRVFIMPTAKPIGDDHFVGLYELAFLYGGFGIMDFISVSAGRSFVPYILQDQQLAVINLKATVYQTQWEGQEGGMYVAAGANLSWVNDNNRFDNIYFVSTFEMERSSLSAGFIYKAGGEEFNDIRIIDNTYQISYPPGSLGIMMGLEKKLSFRNDLYFIGELWNSDISRPSNTGILAGLRLHNSRFSAEFGLSLFTAGILVPFTSFNWTPF